MSSLIERHNENDSEYHLDRIRWFESLTRRMEVNWSLCHFGSKFGLQLNDYHDRCRRFPAIDGFLQSVHAYRTIQVHDRLFRYAAPWVECIQLSAYTAWPAHLIAVLHSTGLQFEERSWWVDCRDAFPNSQLVHPKFTTCTRCRDNAESYLSGPVLVYLWYRKITPTFQGGRDSRCEVRDSELIGLRPGLTPRPTGGPGRVTGLTAVTLPVTSFTASSSQNLNEPLDAGRRRAVIYSSSPAVAGPAWAWVTDGHPDSGAAGESRSRARWRPRLRAAGQWQIFDIQVSSTWSCRAFDSELVVPQALNQAASEPSLGPHTGRQLLFLKIGTVKHAIQHQQFHATYIMLEVEFHVWINRTYFSVYYASVVTVFWHIVSQSSITRWHIRYDGAVGTYQNLLYITCCMWYHLV